MTSYRLKTKGIRLTCVVLMMVLQTSCVEDVDFSSQFVEQMVLNCLLENTSQQTLTLTYNTHLGVTGEAKQVENVIVRLFKDGIPVGDFVRGDGALWTLAYTPESGSTYEIEVCDLSGKRLLHAQTEMPDDEPMEFDDMWARDNSVIGWQKYITGPIWIYVSNSRNPIKDICTDHPYADDFNANGVMEVKRNSLISQDGYPTLISEELSLARHYSYIRIKPTLGSDYIYGEENTFHIWAGHGAYLTVISASDSYDRYLKSSLQELMASSDNSLVGQFREGIIYSGIEGGLGLFGAYCKSTYIVSIAEW